MRIEELSLFKSIAHYRSLSETARQEHFTQPAVSGALSSLEKQLGVRLVERNERQRRPLVLTPEGEILLRYATHILSDYQNMLLDIAYKNITPAPCVISCGRSFSVHILPSLVSRFQETYPDAQLEMKTCSNTGAALNALMHRACDVSLSSLDTRTPGLIYEKLMDDPLVLACPLDMDVPEEITPRQMTRLPFIAREKMSYTSIQIQTALAKHGIDADSLNVRMTVYDNAVAMQAIEMGDGCGFVPRSAVANNRMRRQSVKLVKVKNLDINRSVYLVRREDAPFEGSLKLFWGYALTGKWYENLFTYDPK